MVFKGADRQGRGGGKVLQVHRSRPRRKVSLKDTFHTFPRKKKPHKAGADREEDSHKQDRRLSNWAKKVPTFFTR